MYSLPGSFFVLCFDLSQREGDGFLCVRGGSAGNEDTLNFNRVSFGVLQGFPDQVGVLQLLPQTLLCIFSQNHPV